MIPEIVSAIAASATACIAGGALCFARGQVKEARATRIAVTQPNAVAYIDHNPTNWQYLDLVIKNFGQKPAYGIRLVGLPDLDVVPWQNMETGETVTALYVPETIVVLAPGQEWRTKWESAVGLEEYEVRRRANPELGLRQLRTVYVGKVIYTDGENEKYDNPIQLDTNTFRNVQRLEKR
jgi:hypothetical protein